MKDRYWHGEKGFDGMSLKGCEAVRDKWGSYFEQQCNERQDGRERENERERLGTNAFKRRREEKGDLESRKESTREIWDGESP